MGCRASDHGLDYIPFAETNAEKATAAFKKAMAGETLTKEEGDEYTTYLLLMVALQSVTAIISKPVSGPSLRYILSLTLRRQL